VTVRDIGIDAALSAVGALDVGFKLNALSALSRGEKLLVELQGGLEGFNSLTRSDRALVKAYAATLLKAQESGKVALKELEQAALTNWTGLQANLDSARPMMNANAKTLLSSQKGLRGQVEQAENALKEARATALAGDQASMDKLDRLKSELDGLKGTQSVCRDLLMDATAAPETFALVTPQDVAWLTSRQQTLDTTSLEKLYAKYGQSWKNVKQAFKNGQITKVEMFQIVKWRKQKVDKLLDEVIAEVKAETKSENIWRKALGSINLTSDYDISVYGDHAELVIAKFNERFRSLNGNLESGFVFDTNIYTNPVYKMFTRRALTGSGMELSSSQMDALQQVIYEQMAARKYAKNPAEWEAYKARMLKTDDETTRNFMRYVLSEAEDAHTAAQAALHKKISGLPPEMSSGLASARENVEIRAANDVYADTLKDIDRWRDEYRRMEYLLVDTEKLKTVVIGPQDAEFLAKNPGYKEAYEKIVKLAESGDMALARSVRRDLLMRINGQLRKEQGFSLYFASEAYQTEHTIGHVVGEVQEMGRKITAASLKGPVLKSPIGGLGYLNSFNENYANVIKELAHSSSPVNAAGGGSKYFLRSMDGIKQSGLDLKAIVGTKIIDEAAAVEAVRAEVKKIPDVLKKFGSTPEQYIADLQAAGAKMAAAGLNHPEFKKLTSALKDQFADLDKLKRMSEGLKDDPWKLALPE
jgi:hypothetical protein